MEQWNPDTNAVTPGATGLQVWAKHERRYVRDGPDRMPVGDASRGDRTENGSAESGRGFGAPGAGVGLYASRSGTKQHGINWRVAVDSHLGQEVSCGGKPVSWDDRDLVGDQTRCSAGD